MISPRFAVLVALAAALAAGCNKKSPTTGGAAQTGEGADTVVATYADKKVTARQLEEHIQGNPQFSDELSKLDKQRHELRRQALDNMVLQELVKAEATKQGKTEEEFLRAELEKDTAQPSDEEIKKFFEQVKGNLPEGATLDQVRGQIVNYLTGQQRQERARAYFDDLRKKNNVAITLPSPAVQRKQAEAIGPSKGPEGAKVTIVEFSDFQCPFCGRAAQTVDKVMATYAGKVRLHFRHYPLDFHKEAPKAHEASMCADDQGKFWEYHDELFRNQKALQPEQLKGYAKKLGLDAAKFDACLDSGKYKPAVDKDLADGQKLGVSGTPAFFINGVPLSGAQPFEQFQQIIDEELAKKQ